MNLLPLCLLIVLCVSCATHVPATRTVPRLGAWRAVLPSPGGELPFEFRLMHDEAGWSAEVINGEEVIECGAVSLAGAELSIALEPYDSVLRAEVSEDGGELVGEWRKFLGVDREVVMSLRATHGVARRFPARDLSVEERARLEGRWSVSFESDELPAVGLFEALPDGTASGTFLTALGDYRFLAGVFDGRELRLSCFDGGHAFLFVARVLSDGTLRGDFWSRDAWHEGWTARRDEQAQLEDPFGLSTWTAAMELGDLSFPDLEGRPRSLSDEAFAGRARLISLFGTWCPNCNDEARFLAELDQRYRARGLSILGLAFELTGDHARSAAQVRRFQELHGAQYPVLIAGVADKQAAGQAFPLLDRVRAYPTAIFLDGGGEVRAIHTGFAGPATGEAHEEMRDRYELLIEELLAQ